VHTHARRKSRKRRTTDPRANDRTFNAVRCLAWYEVVDGQYQCTVGANAMCGSEDNKELSSAT